jgi:hypothetical protein
MRITSLQGFMVLFRTHYANWKNTEGGEYRERVNDYAKAAG